MSSAEPPSRSAIPYKPPQHLLTYWSAAELTLQFQGFLESLPYVVHSPELVFERLVGSLNHGSRNSAEQEHRADEELRVQNKSLQESVDQLRTELASLYGKLKAQEKDLNNAQRSSRLIAEVISEPLDIPLTTSSPRASPPIFFRPTFTPADDCLRLVFTFVPTGQDVHVMCRSLTPKSPVEPGGCDWSTIDFLGPECQSGQFTFPSNHGRHVTTSETIISFDKLFWNPVKVLVWLTHINYDAGPLSLHVSATDISSTAFALQIRVGASSKVRSAGIKWVAYPESTRISSGTFITSSDKPGSRLFSRSGSQSVGQRISSLPRYLVAVNALDMGESKRLTLEGFGTIALINFSPPQLSWKISVGPEDACVYLVGMTYLAIED